MEAVMTVLTVLVGILFSIACLFMWCFERICTCLGLLYELFGG